MTRLSRILGLGFSGLVLTTAPLAAQAEAQRDKYAPLITALDLKKQEALLEAEEATLLAEGYEEFLKDPDIEREERPALRRNLLNERNRRERLLEQALQIQTAARSLKGIPAEDELTITILKEAYRGLDELGARGRAAWGQLLTDRDSSVETLQANYHRELTELTAVLDGLETAKKANQLLLDAINSRRAGATDDEFHVALKLPRIKSAIELCFGIEHRPDDPVHEAQTTLVALVGYSQFFWDHFAGAREHLSERDLPIDSARNIFGLADGEILTSTAISSNRSSFYYLSDEGKEPFQHRLKGIWGEDVRVGVKRWNQKHARTFYQACESLSSTLDGALQPDLQAFAVVEEIDVLVAERADVLAAIEKTNRSYGERIADARKFGESARLSSAHFNAEVWARESKQILARYEAAHTILDSQLAASEKEDWTPKAKAIGASVKALQRAQKRIRSVNKVKRELTVLLQ